MKKLIALWLALSVTAAVSAQEDLKKEYESFKQQARNEYSSFRKKANMEYAQFMEEAWKTMNAHDAEDLPALPKPVTPFRADEAPVNNDMLLCEIETETLPKEAVGSPEASAMEAPVDYEQPEPIEPILPKFDEDASIHPLYIYGSAFPFKFNKEKPLKLKNCTEKSVAKMWRKLATPYYDNIVAECLQQRKERNLCDWAYVKLTENVAADYCGDDTNEAVVLQMYLLTQSGYQMRMARVDDRLTLLMGSKEKIFRYKYFILDGTKFYIIDRSLQNKPMDVFDKPFPGEQSMSLAVTQPLLVLDKTEQKEFASARYPDMKVNVAINRNLMDFFNDCPITAKWDYYSKASMSGLLKQSMYPALREILEGKDELTKVNMLLDFVQNGFDYETDGDQFGYERPLYPDECFYYPYCDCEDRSILFSCLVRELVGLDVVLLDYPNHIAAAVHFNQEVKGDYLMVDGVKYVISDPTFINAPVGRCYSKFKTMVPKIVKI